MGEDQRRPRERTDRQHPLKGTLGTRTVNGEDMEQWQYEVTGGGRLWYVIEVAPSQASRQCFFHNRLGRARLSATAVASASSLS